MERNYPNVPWPGWETIDILGHGNFGTVYKIQRTTRGRTECAALKVIRIPKEESEIAKLRQDDYDDESITQYYADCLNKIEDEYAMMAELKGYANIVYCDDYFSQPHENGFGWDIYIKMELLTPLKAYLPAAIPEEQVISLGIDICNALTRCEELKIVHRDIKPENIFVSKEGKYKLGDFGIARTMEGTTGGTKTGTFDYMAPEVNNSKAYHTEVDIYSLGLVMYWMLNERTGPFLPLGGKKPTPSMKQVAWDRRFAGEQIPAPQNGSDELKAIVLKACAYNPKERYQSAKDMLFALEALKAGAMPATEPAPISVVVHVEDTVEPEDLTVGPGWGNTAEETVAEENMTVGPSWNKTPATEDNDVTVGPMFRERETQKKHTEQKIIERGEQENQHKEIKIDNVEKKSKHRFAFLLLIPLLLFGVILVASIWAISQNGWVQEDNIRYYYRDGQKSKGWTAVDGDVYFFDENGAPTFGWLEVNRAAAYYDENGKLQSINSGRYYFDAHGIMQTGWQEIDGVFYYFDKFGAMQTGWQTINGVNTFLGDDGVLASGWQEVDGDTYYFVRGVSYAGWQRIEDKNYYFNISGQLIPGLELIDEKTYYNDVLLTGWQEINGEDYYFGTDGVMAKGACWIDGEYYYFDHITGTIDYSRM